METKDYDLEDVTDNLDPIGVASGNSDSDGTKEDIIDRLYKATNSVTKGHYERRRMGFY